MLQAGNRAGVLPHLHPAFDKLCRAEDDRQRNTCHSTSNWYCLEWRYSAGPLVLLLVLLVRVVLVVLVAMQLLLLLLVPQKHG
jgi:hypothetical protein